MQTLGLIKSGNVNYERDVMAMGGYNTKNLCLSLKPSAFPSDQL